METKRTIREIDFDGASIKKAIRIGCNMEIMFIVHDETIRILFNSISEEKSHIYKSMDEKIVNEIFPPLDRIETFKNTHKKYVFSGYLKNEPWCVWEFKAKNYVISQ